MNYNLNAFVTKDLVEQKKKVIINNVLFLMFNEHEFVYVENLSNKIPSTNLKDYLKKLILILCPQMGIDKINNNDNIYNQ